MTKAFDLFMKEYRSTGREKLDGYSLSFSEMTESEREEAKRLLRHEMHEFYGAIEPLVVLDKEVALAELKVEEKSLEENDKKGMYKVYYWIFKIAGDRDYALKFCNCRKYLTRYDISPYYSYASQISYSSDIEGMLRASIFTESDETGLSTAARTLLNKYGYSRDIPERKDQYLTMWRTLTEGDAEQKRAVLDSLG